MNSSEPTSSIPSSNRGFVLTAGIALIAFGLVILADQYLKTGWLSLLVPAAAGCLLLIEGIQGRKLGYIIPGSLLTGAGASIYVILSPLLSIELSTRIALSVLLVTLSWVLIALVTQAYLQKMATWALIPAFVSALLAGFLFLAPWRLLDLVFYIGGAVGVALLGSGVFTRKFGLIIPGCLSVTVNLGVFIAWMRPIESNDLARTGIMLVTFALGWGLITLFSHVITISFVWWPLIPGGVLAMVGWGLYLAGNPGNALSFIGNTGSIGLIIFGIYLLLWRASIRH